MKTSSLLLFIISLLLLLHETNSQGKKGKTKFDKYQRKRKDECSQKLCRHLPRDLNENCVNQCFSLNCFNKVYAEKPLEDGEYDGKR